MLDKDSRIDAVGGDHPGRYPAVPSEGDARVYADIASMLLEGESWSWMIVDRDRGKQYRVDQTAQYGGYLGQLLLALENIKMRCSKRNIAFSDLPKDDGLLDYFNILGLRAFFTFSDFEFYSLTFTQGAETLGIDR